MAPIKRRRQREDEEGDVSAQSTSTAGRQEDPKKARISGHQRKHFNHDNDPHASGSESDDQPYSARYDEGPPLTQYEIDRDGNFEHLAHEADDDALATRRFRERKETIGENHAADNGIIMTVEMINFMCHERLKVTLGPLINFIIGENGSGKSTILTAITLCLGGKASTTNRGGSLKSFIKSGQDEAVLIIKLKNEGIDAYQSDLYGDSITVERRFSHSGSGGFKLKNELGRTVSTKKSDVEDFIEYFQMQVDNPMNVLSQDAARQFLNQSTPAQKYKFFVKGVQLEQLDNDYRLLQETIDNIEVRMEGMESNVKALKRAKDLADEKSKLVSQHKDMRDAVRQYGRQSAWAQVEEEEKILHERERIVLEAQSTLEDKRKEVSEKDALFQQTHQKAELANEAVKTSQDGMEPLKEDELQMRERFDNATQDLQSNHLEQRQIREHLSAAKRKAQGFQKDIDAEQQRMEDANGGGHTKKLNEHAMAQDKVAEAVSKLTESDGERLKLEDAKKEADDTLRKAQDPIDIKKREISTCQERLEALRRDAGSTASGHDPKISQLMKLIQEDKDFLEKPVGPVGDHIKLLKPMWSNVLERSIGSLLSGFIVTSKSDQQRLSDMIHRIGIYNCPVVVGNHQSIDTRGHEPDEQFDTVLRVLEIDNELVRRQLIITQAIEQTILIEKRADAERIMYGGPRPPFVKQCFVIHPTKRGWGLRLGFMQGGGNDTSAGSIQPPNNRPRMKTDIDSQIAMQKETLEHLRRELGSLQRRKQECDQASQRCSQALTQHKRSHQALKVALQRNEEAVERLQEELDKDNVEDGRLEALKEYLREAEDEVQLHERSYGDSGLAKEKLNQVCSAIKKQYDEAKLKVKDHEYKIKKAQDKFGRVQQARSIALQDKNQAVQSAEEMEKRIAEAEGKRNKQKLRVETFIEGASKVCERVAVPENESAASLDAKLHSLTEQIRTYNKRLGGSDDQILAACARANAMYNTAQLQYKNIQATLQLLKVSYEKRIEIWRKFQRAISARARINFMYLLSERGFRGKLKFDHKAKLLDLNIEPDETVRSEKGRQTKTLSGGEKSFSSICLLLSLWEAMGAPLRCLDEFDVFMDNVNRDVSTNMIITAARRSVGRQYILITPNAIGGGAEHDKDVKIIRLSDPRQKRLTDI